MKEACHAASRTDTIRRTLTFTYAAGRRAVWIALALLAQVSLSSAKGDVARPTLHELAAIEARGGPRLWYHEEEFGRHSRLRAEPHQVVILHLEPAGQGRKPIRNAIPYRFAETASYTFCVPKDEPHIRSIELRRENSHGMEVQVSRGGPCKTQTIKAGRYQLDVEHDGSRIGAAGKKAFLHVPSAQSSSFPSCSDVSALPDENTLVLFAAPNGSYVVGDADSHKVVTTTALQNYWTICHDNDGNYQILQPTGGPPRVFFSAGPPSTDTTLYSLQAGPSTAPTAFKLTDLGSGQFTLAANFAGTLYPIVLDADGALHWTTSGTPATFATVLTYSPQGVAAQPLQPGEAALFQSCNYDVRTTGTWVFNTTISDFQPFNVPAFSGALDNTVAAAKVGPQTIATLYANPNFSGTSQVIGADTPCLNGTALGSNAASSLRIVPARQFVAQTASCQYCNLTGVDLNDLDLSGGNFTGTVFNQANLTDTVFQSAILDNAKFRSYAADGDPTILTGANFLGAALRCADFQASDLRQAFLVFNGPPAVLPVITKDFSCRLQLQNATLSLATFPLSDWRYFTLDDASITDASGQVLSSTSKPLDLSQAQLSGTLGLTRIDLTAANIAGAKFMGTDLTGAILNYAILDSAQLTGASLLNASLIRASLSNALLQGAILSSTNLDGANLSSAKLNRSPDFISAKLEGSFLRNVNLYSADLTGVSLKNSNFYSSAPSSNSTCNQSPSGFNTSCASAAGAVLDNADFSGAYLAGVDFSGSFSQAANFSGAFLMGSNFTQADLTGDSSTGKVVSFENAYIQGTNFTSATVTGADFTSAVVDLTNTNGQTLRIQLDPTTHLTFPGYTPHAGSDLGCVQFSTARKTTVPLTDSLNICPDKKHPDGTEGDSCSQNQWSAIPQPAPSSCSHDSNWTSTSGIY